MSVLFKLASIKAAEEKMSIFVITVFAVMMRIAFLIDPDFLENFSDSYITKVVVIFWFFMALIVSLGSLKLITEFATCLRDQVKFLRQWVARRLHFFAKNWEGTELKGRVEKEALQELLTALYFQGYSLRILEKLLKVNDHIYDLEVVSDQYELYYFVRVKGLVYRRNYREL